MFFASFSSFFFREREKREWRRREREESFFCSLPEKTHLKKNRFMSGQKAAHCAMNSLKRQAAAKTAKAAPSKKAAVAPIAA